MFSYILSNQKPTNEVFRRICEIAILQHSSEIVTAPYTNKALDIGINEIIVLTSIYVKKKKIALAIDPENGFLFIDGKALKEIHETYNLMRFWNLDTSLFDLVCYLLVKRGFCIAHINIHLNTGYLTIKERHLKWWKWLLKSIFRKPQFKR